MSDVIFDAGGIADIPLFETLDEGIYPVQITKVESGASKQKGTPYIEITGTVLEGGPVQKSGSVPTGRTIRHTLYFAAGRNSEISKAQMRDLYKKVNLEFPADGRMRLSELVGGHVMFIVKIGQDDKGNERNEVKGFKDYN